MTHKKTLLQRLNFLFLIMVFFILTIFTAFKIGTIVESINRIYEGKLYVIVSKWDFPLILCLPAYVALITIFTLRLMDQDTEKRINACMKIVIISGLLFVIARIPYGFISSYYLTTKGYSACWGLSRHQLMSPTVWVKNPGYCVNSASGLRKNILTWLDSLPNDDREVSPIEVQEKVKSMHNLYHEKQKNEYPHLYD